MFQSSIESRRGQTTRSINGPVDFDMGEDDGRSWWWIGAAVTAGLGYAAVLYALWNTLSRTAG